MKCKSMIWGEFPIISKKFLNANKINSLQQMDVFKMIEYAKNDKNIKTIIIFGSSTSFFYNSESSDTDIYLELNNENFNWNDFYKNVNFRNSMDVFTNFDLNKEDEFYKNEILEKGVVVYEK